MEYTKPFLTFEKQADLLIQERGLIVDKQTLIQHLKLVGYYRLSGYWFIYKKPDSDVFWDGITFQMVWNNYLFDRQLRLIVLDAVERVEIYLRNQLVFQHGKRETPFEFLQRENLPRLQDEHFAKFVKRCKKACLRSRRSEQFISHFYSKYGDSHDLPPLWILANIMDFGMVVTFYRGSSVDIRQDISHSIGISTAVLDSWLISLNTTRNICAHHGRLWNRVIGTAAKIPKDEKWHKPYEIMGDKIFGILTILSYLLTYIAPDTNWHTRLFNLLDSVPENNFPHMGFPEKWQEHPIWRERWQKWIKQE